MGTVCPTTRSSSPLEGVYNLRTVNDADRIRSEVAPGRKVVIVGMGFIGSEVAASLRMLGAEVSVIARSKLPLDRVLGEEIARVKEVTLCERKSEQPFKKSTREEVFYLSVCYDGQVTGS